MIRRIGACFAVLASLCAAQTSFDRLAATAKLWAYVKYIHPRVTAPEVDWDAAFAKAAPKVLAAKTDAQSEAAVNEMLGALHDPATHLAPPAPPMEYTNAPVVATVSNQNGVTIVRFENGDATQAMLTRDALLPKIRGKNPVVFDLRGSKLAPDILPAVLPAAVDSAGPSARFRAHSGYAPPDLSFVGGAYESLWQIREGVKLPANTNPITPIFLVNHETNIPPMAFAFQNSGAGAIVSEDEISDEEVVSSPAPAETIVGAIVRTAELVYADGSTGLSANIVLNKTGDEALASAVEIARSGKWPPTPRKAAVALLPAQFIEKPYGDQPYPAPEYRMLAAARIWGVFQYFHPYRHLYDEDWDAVLKAFLPKMAAAQNAREYQLAVAEMVAHTRDSHCWVSSHELTQFYGIAPPGIELRWIENRPVVTRVMDAILADRIHPGDELTKIDGEPYARRAEDLEKHIAASTPQAMKSRIMSQLLNGPDNSEVRVTIKTGSGPEREVTLNRTVANFPKMIAYRAGEIFYSITPKIGYVDLARLSNAQVDAMFEKFVDTDAIVLDMRGYQQGTSPSIASRLSEKAAPIAVSFRLNFVTAEGLGEKNFLGWEQHISAATKPRYKGKTVMLIDERAISAAEHSGLFYRAANGTVFIGSPTTGADGAVTWFQAPGAIRITFSGEDVRWPDGKQLQRVGLKPDVEVYPTIEGIRAGRDEVLDRAVAYLVTGR